MNTEGRKVLSFLRQYVIVIFTGSITIALTLASDFLLHLPDEFTWLTFFVGSIITVATTLLEIRVADTASTEISRKLETRQLYFES